MYRTATNTVPTVAIPIRQDPMAQTLTVATLTSPLMVVLTLTAQAATDLGTKLMACTTVKHNDRNTMALASMVVTHMSLATVVSTPMVTTLKILDTTLLIPLVRVPRDQSLSTSTLNRNSKILGALMLSVTPLRLSQRLLGICHLTALKMMLKIWILERPLISM